METPAPTSTFSSRGLTWRATGRIRRCRRVVRRQLHAGLQPGKRGPKCGQLQRRFERRGLQFQPSTITVTASASNLDVDGNGQCDALTDGVLIMRYLFDPNGPWTTDGAVGVGATRTTHDQIKAYLDSASAMLDVDGNGQCDALSDGMLIMRYLFDPSGNWTTTGLIGTGATRTTAASIKTFWIPSASVPP